MGSVYDNVICFFVIYFMYKKNIIYLNFFLVIISLFFMYLVIDYLKCKIFFVVILSYFFLKVFFLF